MKKFKYNLLGRNVCEEDNFPHNYRFVQYGEHFEIGDFWWDSREGCNVLVRFERRSDYTSIWNYPIPIFGANIGGYIRKIE